MPAAWPTQSDLTAYLEGNGMPAAVSVALAQAALDAARQEFLRITGWPSWLPAVGKTRTFDGPLQTSEGLVLDIGAWRTVTAVSLDGAVQTLGAENDYLLGRFRGEADDSVDEPNPITSLRLLRRTTWRPGGIVVTGTEGYASEIPNDAWLAVLGMAAVRVIGPSHGAIGPISELEQGDVRIRRDTQAGRGVPDTLRREFYQAANRHRRVL